jgi:hypothetical protein
MEKRERDGKKRDRDGEKREKWRKEKQRWRKEREIGGVKERERGREVVEDRERWSKRER